MDKSNVIQASDILDYCSQYQALIQQGFGTIDPNALREILAVVQDTKKAGKSIYVAGNGGSAAICNHLSCDWTKGTYSAHSTTLKTHSLSSNVSLLTAISNDFSYEESFSKQVEYYLSPGDVVLLISSSGNSPNIIRAAQQAKKQGAKLIGFSGFSGGELRRLSDISIHIAINNYGVVEDVHQSVMHVIAQYIQSLQ